MSPFDFLNSINSTKKNLFEDPQVEKDYSSYLINRGLSYFPDTILYANEMNQNFNIDKKWQFDFLVNTITPKKRFSKWYKKEVVVELVKLIQNHYKYSESKALEVIDLLTPSQIDEIKSQYDLGGRS